MRWRNLFRHWKGHKSGRIELAVTDSHSCFRPGAGQRCRCTISCFCLSVEMKANRVFMPWNHVLCSALWHRAIFAFNSTVRQKQLLRNCNFRNLTASDLQLAHLNTRKIMNVNLDYKPCEWLLHHGEGIFAMLWTGTFQGSMTSFDEGFGRPHGETIREINVAEACRADGVLRITFDVHPPYSWIRLLREKKNTLY